MNIAFRVANSQYHWELCYQKSESTQEKDDLMRQSMKDMTHISFVEIKENLGV